MAIISANIKNFTVFKSFNIKFSKNINIIIGENGTGKTHLLKGMYAMGKSDENGSNHFVMQEYFNVIFNDLLRDTSKSLRLSFDIEFYINEKNHWRKIKAYKTSENSGNIVSEKPVLDEEDRMYKEAYEYIYIPTKDFLTHSRGFMSLYDNNRIAFDKSYYDIISKALLPELRIMPDIAQTIVPMLEKVIDGKIVMEKDVFFIQKHNGQKINFSIEAEGIKRLGLLWQLLMNGSIKPGTTIFWDEPESNINPTLIPVVVEILLELSRNGVQIFVATHDYIFAKYFEVKRSVEDQVLFHALYKTEHGVQCESNVNFRDLQCNSIVTAFNELLDEVIDKNLGE